MKRLLNALVATGLLVTSISALGTDMTVGYTQVVRRKFSLDITKCMSTFAKVESTNPTKKFGYMCEVSMQGINPQEFVSPSSTRLDCGKNIVGCAVKKFKYDTDIRSQVGPAVLTVDVGALDSANGYFANIYNYGDMGQVLTTDQAKNYISDAFSKMNSVITFDVVRYPVATPPPVAVN
jgi:hypothetical protein